MKKVKRKSAKPRKRKLPLANEIAERKKKHLLNKRGNSNATN